MEHINRDYEFLLKPYQYSFKQYMIIQCRIWYLKNCAGFYFTEKELDIAEKRKDGFIGVKNNVRCHLRKLI